MLRVSSRAANAGVMLSMVLGLMTQTCRADRIILRNLESVDKQVVSFNFDGIQFSDGTALGWEQIKSGRVDAAKQDAFNQYLEKLGEPLYRIRIRLQNQDYKDILEQAEALYPQYQDRQSKTAYMVCQSLMWARLAHGQRAAAVAPYLRCYAYLRGKRKTKEDIPGNRELVFDRVTGMTPEIQPIWFDSDAASQALAELGRTIQKLPKPQPKSARIYYGTMAIAAGQHETGRRVLAGLGTSKGPLGELVLIGAVQIDLAQGKDSGVRERLCAARETISEQNRALATYWCGVGEAKTDLNGGLLLLMRVAALYGQSHPDLAAAALATAIAEIDAGKSDDPLQRKRISILRRELLQSFPGSYHAKKILSEINVATDEPS